MSGPSPTAAANVRRAWLRILMADIRAYAAKCEALAAEQSAQQTAPKEKV